MNPRTLLHWIGWGVVGGTIGATHMAALDEVRTWVLLTAVLVIALTGGRS